MSYGASISRSSYSPSGTLGMFGDSPFQLAALHPNVIQNQAFTPFDDISRDFTSYYSNQFDPTINQTTIFTTGLRPANRMVCIQQPRPAGVTPMDLNAPVYSGPAPVFTASLRPSNRMVNIQQPRPAGVTPMDLNAPVYSGPAPVFTVGLKPAANRVQRQLPQSNQRQLPQSYQQQMNPIFGRMDDEAPKFAAANSEAPMFTAMDGMTSFSPTCPDHATIQSSMIGTPNRVVRS